MNSIRLSTPCLFLLFIIPVFDNHHMFTSVETEHLTDNKHHFAR